MTGFLVKICGNLYKEESLAVCEFEPDFMGWIFSPLSPRKILPDDAVLQIEEIRKKYPNIRHCAVFAGNSSDEILNVSLNFGVFDIFQIAENESFLADLRKKMHSGKRPLNSNISNKNKIPEICPAVRVRKYIKNSDLEDYGKASLYILDSYVEGQPGGTGKTLNQKYIQDITKPYLLAGGLNPENVRDSLLSVSALGADVSSGIEVRPGIKDRKKLKAFIETVRELKR